MPFKIYADLECLLVKQQLCQNNLDKSYIERKAIHEPCGYSLDLITSFDKSENKHSFYRGKNCIKKFCKEIKEISTKLVNWKQKDMDPLTSEEEKIYDNRKKMSYMQKTFYF